MGGGAGRAGRAGCGGGPAARPPPAGACAGAPKGALPLSAAPAPVLPLAAGAPERKPEGTRQGESGTAAGTGPGLRRWASDGRRQASRQSRDEPPAPRPSCPCGGDQPGAGIWISQLPKAATAPYAERLEPADAPVTGRDARWQVSRQEDSAGWASPWLESREPRPAWLSGPPPPAAARARGGRHLSPSRHLGPDLAARRAPRGRLGGAGGNRGSGRLTVAAWAAWTGRGGPRTRPASEAGGWGPLPREGGGSPSGTRPSHGEPNPRWAESGVT